MHLLVPILSIFLFICTINAAVYHKDDDSNDVWDDSTSSESEEDNNNDTNLKKFFKSSEQLESPSEVWPEHFYRRMSICQHDIFPQMVTKEEGNCSEPNATIATGLYHNAQNKTGWGILEIETFPGFPPEMQAYAAGLVEGVLTKVQIFYHYWNTVRPICLNQTEYCKKLYQYLNANLHWIATQVIEKPPTDLYWRQVNLTFIQLTGINDGYTVDKAQYLPRSRFYITPVFMLQLSGELFDLNHLFKKKPNMTEEDYEPGHCSGFVRVTEGNKDMLMSHVAMSGFETMNRVVKLYKFAYDKKEVPGNTVSFSGYAGVLASVDDYTLTNAGLLSIETTIAVFNETLYQLYVKPENQLHCWVRSYISNQLAATAHDWVKIFARYNSGTYNNQWTVVDYKLFKPGQTLPDANVVWILEQIPGTCVSRDVTWFLKKYGYWPSYNIPYLSKISTLSGFDVKGNTNNWWRWGFTPRAKIFHRDQAKVNNITQLQALMRYNDYQHDEFSRCKCTPPYTAEAGVSARGDLNPPNGTWEVAGMGFRNHGGVDYKGTNYTFMKLMRIELRGGPTYGGPGNLPYFSWDTTKVVTPHMGQPTNWNFESFVTLWRTPVEVNFGDDEW